MWSHRSPGRHSGDPPTGIPTSAESPISWLRIRRTLPLGSGKAAMPSNALGTTKPSLTEDASPPELRRMQAEGFGNLEFGAVRTSDQVAVQPVERTVGRLVRDGRLRPRARNCVTRTRDQPRQRRRNDRGSAGGSELLQERAARDGHERSSLHPAHGQLVPTFSTKRPKESGCSLPPGARARGWCARWEGRNRRRSRRHSGTIRR